MKVQVPSLDGSSGTISGACQRSLPGAPGLMRRKGRRLPLGWLAYTIVSLLLIHSNIPFRSTARYEVVLFPIFVLIPWTIFARPPIAPFVAGLLVLLQAYLLLKFASWQWVA